MGFDVELPLTKGHTAVIDSIDSDLFFWKWQANVRPNGVVYVQRTGKMEGDTRERTLQLHRIIMSRILKRPLISSEHVDHKDRNGLNNRRSNLRLATQSQNMANTKLSSNNTSGYKGVSYHKPTRKWRASITVRRTPMCLGYFDTIEEAIEVRKTAARWYFGAFARED